MSIYKQNRNSKPFPARPVITSISSAEHTGWTVIPYAAKTCSCNLRNPLVLEKHDLVDSRALLLKRWHLFLRPHSGGSLFHSKINIQNICYISHQFFAIMTQIYISSFFLKRRTPYSSSSVLIAWLSPGQCSGLCCFSVMLNLQEKRAAAVLAGSIHLVWI